MYKLYIFIQVAIEYILLMVLPWGDDLWSGGFPMLHSNVLPFTQALSVKNPELFQHFARIDLAYDSMIPDTESAHKLST